MGPSSKSAADMKKAMKKLCMKMEVGEVGEWRLNLKLGCRLPLTLPLAQIKIEPDR